MSRSETIKALIKSTCEAANAGCGKVYTIALFITDIPTLERFIPPDGSTGLGAATFITRGTSSNFGEPLDEGDGNRYAVAFEEAYKVQILRAYSFEAAQSETEIDRTFEAVREKFDEDAVRQQFRTAGFAIDTPDQAEFGTVDFNGMGVNLYSSVTFMIMVRDLV